uniref:Secreted protein n=1 Tax=Myotis myotis TaxID=51298 RepID=A0A7J7Z647_MYOMY|nr:hypothetical protein mMyoMyo1_010754 [Myotis myotis]
MPGKLVPPWMPQVSLFRMLGLLSGVLESLSGNPEVRCALCAGDSAGTVEAGVQRSGGKGTNQKRRQGLTWQGSGNGRAGFRRHLESQFCYLRWQADGSCSAMKYQWVRGDLTSERIQNKTSCHSY